jgi:hypothetical protein
MLSAMSHISKEPLLLLASLVAALACSNASAHVNRCVDSNGRVEYRSTPCDAQARSQTLPLQLSHPESDPPTPDRALAAGVQQATYALSGDTLVVTDKISGKTSPVPLPTSFPSFSWPTGVAHDTDLNIVTVVTMGGEGFLYRYDAARHQWLDYRSLNGIDFKSLAYDQQKKLYVGRTSDGATVSISSQGELIAAQSRGRSVPNFGTSATAVNAPQLPLLRKVPPRELASNAEVFVVSGYEHSAQVTRVRLNRPGKRVLLVLSTYEKTLWRVEPSAGTTISGVVLASFSGESGVLADSPLPVYVTSLPYAYETDNINFRQLLQQLNAWFGVTKVDALRGKYQLSSPVDINAPDPGRPELTLSGVSAAVPSSVFGIDLLTRDLRRVGYRNDGSSSVPQEGQNLLGDSKTAISGSGRQAYILAEDRLQVMDIASGQKSVVPLPPGFPAFSWATGVAYDTDQDIVTVVTLGGEGFLYRYDAKTRQWRDFRSLNDIDLTALSYDTARRRYVAWTSNGELLFISSDGKVLDRQPLKSRMIGFGAI